MKTNSLLKGKAGELFRPSDISNIKISNVLINEKKIMRLSFVDNHSISYKQEEWPTGEIITNKTSTYGVKEIVTEQKNGEWMHKVIENNNLITSKIYDGNNIIIG